MVLYTSVLPLYPPTHTHTPRDRDTWGRQIALDPGEGAGKRGERRAKEVGGEREGREGKERDLSRGKMARKQKRDERRKRKKRNKDS